MPKISVAVAIYNTENYLRQCLDSIINQTLKDIEIILVDDGSIDQSGVICEEYADSDKRVTVVHQKNQGLSAARNQGLKMARGEWFIGIDSDDWCDLSYLENLLKAAESEDDVDIVIANCKRVIEKEDGFEIENRTAFQKEFKTDIKEEIAKLQANTVAARVNFCDAETDIVALRSIATSWDKIYKTSIIKNNNLQFLPGCPREDVVFTLNYFHYVKCAKYIHEFGYNYRVLPDSLSHGFHEALVNGDRIALNALYDYVQRIPDDAVAWRAIILQGVYVAAIRFYMDELERWFFHSQNERSLEERLNTLDNLLRHDFYNKAFYNVNEKNLSEKEKEFVILARKSNAREIYKRWKSS